MPERTYEIESLDKEIRRTIIDEGYYSEVEYPFKIKPNFSVLGSLIESQAQGPKFGSVFDDTIGNL